MKKELVFTIEFVVAPKDLIGPCIEDALGALQSVGSAEVVDVSVRETKKTK